MSEHDTGGELAADHDAAYSGPVPTFTVGGGGTVQAQAPAVVTCSGGVRLPDLGARNG